MAKFLKSFYYAANGVVKAVQAERNMRFHLCISIYVLLFSFFYSFTALEYAVIILAICGVTALEVVNSAIERLADNPPPGRYHIAGIIKDMAAGAVLIFSIGAAVIGVLFFWDLVVFRNIFSFFASNIILLALLILSFFACAVFVIKDS